MDKDEQELMARLNSQPVNRKAKQMLEASGQEPVAGCLHCVQLASWALDRGWFLTEDAIFETVRAMAGWKPVRLVNFLMVNKGDEYAPEGWEETRRPEELARVILDDIERRAYVTFPWYGSAGD